MASLEAFLFAKEGERMDAATRFDTRIVGALPVITGYLDELRLAEVIDSVVPWDGEVPLGTLVEVMICNRLLEPKALFRLDEWAQTAAVTDYFGLEPGQLNDDRLGRALERLPAYADKIQPGLVLRAIQRFKLTVTQVHYDVTDVELFGAYEIETPEGQPPPTPMPAYGRTKSGRKNVKQIQLGMNVTGDGGVPISHLPLDGNAAEAPTHLDNLRRLRAMLPTSKLLYIADTKLDTPENLLTVAAHGGEFLCGGAFAPHMKELFLKNRQRLRRVDYHPKSQDRLPPEERDEYQAFELEDFLEGTVDGKNIRKRYRQIFVWSEAKARQETATRERHVAKITEQFEAVQRNLNKYSLKTEEVILRRLEAARAKYDEGELFTYDLTRDRRGQFVLSWKLEAKALERRKLLEGVYVLKTNLSKQAYPLAKTLGKYKEQNKVERRIHHLKGPLAVAPMFLKNPERIAGLLCILVWALMVLALMERQVRRSMKGKPLYGLYPENRPSPAPTGPALLNCFSTLCVVLVTERGTTFRRLAQLTQIQTKLLRLLGIPPNGLRTFKRRCGM
ncbi:MAG TPA: IS1634 family transposase [Fimbriimonas sp.]|nr:IS1634 family transposase [Fimbriimonas sp.]